MIVMATYRMLDLFSGNGGASSAMRNDNKWEVITLDIDSKFGPDIVADIRDMTPDDFRKYGDIDLIWASPPCTRFSIAQQPSSFYYSGKTIMPYYGDSVEAIDIVYHTLWLIGHTNPRYWFLENPRGWLRKIIGKPAGTVDYCMYGSEYKKPTDLWGIHPPSFQYRRCNGLHKHKIFADIHRAPEDRAIVPYELSKAVKEAIEDPLGPIDRWTTR